VSPAASSPRIDLHLHTTASDGRLTPSALVALANDVGLGIMSITDHDTVAGLAEAKGAAATLGLRLIDGIEMTAIEDGRDVHVLGYFFDPGNQDLNRFLHIQRLARVERVREIGERLASLGFPIDVAALLREVPGTSGRSVGRPLIADALVAAGHAVDRRDAFDRLLGNDRPAFVPRGGPSVAAVVATIAAAGGIASLAHPGLTRVDDRIPGYVADGLSALEARHREHKEADEARYRALAAELGLAVSGGSDFHGPYDTRDGASSNPGSVTLDPADFAILEARSRAIPSPARDGATQKAKPSA
jgi:predicted metal-dependent phosphoesterase TrpH